MFVIFIAIGYFYVYFMADVTFDGLQYIYSQQASKQQEWVMKILSDSGPYPVAGRHISAVETAGFGTRIPVNY